MTNPKEILRTEALRHRARFDPRSESAEAATDHFLLSVKPTSQQIIAAYWPLNGEFDTRPMLDDLLQRGFTCALPVMQKDSRVLKFALWNDKLPLKASQFGVMEPVMNNLIEWTDPDIVIVPMLAFDRRGYRLGHGYGYYDATLTDLRTRKKILAVGVAYGQQACLFNLPVEPHDQKMDLIITPGGAQDFRDQE
jgi:5-formyltetrahydrofolate cyclo-ligase